MPSVKRQASWLTTDPIVTKDGEILTLEPDDLLPADIDTLVLAHEFHLSSDFAGPLTGRSEENARRRFKQLRRSGYIDVAEPQRQKPWRYWNDFKYYGLTKTGYRILKERDLILPPRYPRSSSLDHDVLAHQDILSARIAAYRHFAAIDLILPQEMQEHLPENAAKAWFDLPLSKTMQGQSVIRPDYFPIGVQRHFDPKKPLFFVLELETGSNHIPQTNYENSNLGFKVLAWLDVLQHDTYYEKLNIPNLYVVFSVLYEERFNDFRKLLQTLVPAEFQQYFLYKLHPTFKEKRPDFPNVTEYKRWVRQKQKEKAAQLGYFLETDFERVTGPFNFMTSKE